MHLPGELLSWPEVDHNAGSLAILHTPWDADIRALDEAEPRDAYAYHTQSSEYLVVSEDLLKAAQPSPEHQLSLPSCRRRSPQQYHRQRRDYVDDIKDALATD